MSNNEVDAAIRSAVENRRAYEAQLDASGWNARLREIESHARLLRRIDAIEAYILRYGVKDAEGKPAFTPGE